MKQMFWTTERQAEFRALKESGKSKTDLATHFGVSTNAINGQMFRQGYTKANKRRGQRTIPQPQQPETVESDAS